MHANRLWFFIISAFQIIWLFILATWLGLLKCIRIYFLHLLPLLLLWSPLSIKRINAIKSLLFTAVHTMKSPVCLWHTFHWEEEITAHLNAIFGYHFNFATIDVMCCLDSVICFFVPSLSLSLSSSQDSTTISQRNNGNVCAHMCIPIFMCVVDSILDIFPIHS